MLSVLDHTFSTLADNLAVDEALLLEAEAGRSGEVLRFWEWAAPAVVLGSGCFLADDVDEAACQGDGVPITRRSSGGGTVLLGAGCLCYTLVLAYDRALDLHGIRSSYCHILGRIRAALADAVPGVACAGISDLAAAGRKFSGNSQQRKRAHLLHHGTLLYAFDLAQVARYLRPPARQPDYRHGRPHGDFLTNLALSAAELKSRLCRTWDATPEISAWPESLVRQLTAEKYACPDWTRRR